MSYRHKYWREHDMDSYACPLCGSTRGPFHVHHRNGKRFDNRLENLVGLCAPCHRQLHREGGPDPISSVDDWKRAFVEDLINV